MFTPYSLVYHFQNTWVCRFIFLTTLVMPLYNSIVTVVTSVLIILYWLWKIYVHFIPRWPGFKTYFAFKPFYFLSRRLPVYHDLIKETSWLLSILSWFMIALVWSSIKVTRQVWLQVWQLCISNLCPSFSKDYFPFRDLSCSWIREHDWHLDSIGC